MIHDVSIGPFWRRFNIEEPQLVIYDVISRHSVPVEVVSLLLPPCMRAQFEKCVARRIALLNCPKSCSLHVRFTYADLPSPDWPTFELMHRRGKEAGSRLHTMFYEGMSQLIAEHYQDTLSDRYLEARIRLLVYFMYGYALAPQSLSVHGSGGGAFNVIASNSSTGPHVIIFESSHEHMP